MPTHAPRHGLLKILHVYRTYFPDSQGGLEEVIRQVCLNTRRLGVESRVFTLSENPTPAIIDAPEGRVVRVLQNFEIASCGFTFGGLREFRQQVEWADLVHYHFPWPYADVMYSLYGRSRPSILTYHSDIVRQKVLAWMYGPLMRRFLNRMDRIVATSPNYLATSDVLARVSSDVEIVPIGLSPSSYPADADLVGPRQRVARDFGEGFFLFVGVLRYYKGLHILLEAMQGAGYRAVIVGKGPEEAALRRRARELGLDNVIFAGYLPDEEKMALLESCRAVVFPSYLRSEAFGVTLLEGAMSGKPLISAEVGSGSSHINLHEHTGLVVTPGDPASLRAAMDRLYGDTEFARALGERARERFQALFTGEVMGAAYARIYRDVLAGPLPGSQHSGSIA